jgi:hypothetical protein
MQTRSLIAAQSWKLYVGLALVIGGAILMWLPDAVSGALTYMNAVGGLSAAAGIAWLLFSLACPRCSLRLFPYAISTQDASGWLQWLMHSSSCPRCGYESGTKDHEL